MEPSNTDVNDYKSPFQLTKSIHKDLYPALDPKNPDLSASGKVVMITCAEGRIGSDCATVCATAWATAGAAGVILVGRNMETLIKITGYCKTIAGSLATMTYKTDITSESDVEALYHEIATNFMVVDVLINNAVTWNYPYTGDIRPVRWWQYFECHVKSPYLMSHYFIKYFGAKGTIINISSMDIGLVMPGFSLYSASKLAMVKTSEYLQKEHPSLRVFCCMQDIVERKPTRPTARLPYNIDGMLTGPMSLYLSTPRADFLKGSLVSDNWDIVEMEQHKDEIVKHQLLNLGFLNAKLGPEGHAWETRPLDSPQGLMDLSFF